MSTPALTLFDYEGAHNKDMAGSRARLIKGGSWKRQRVVVILPAGEMIPTKVFLNYWNLAFPPNNGVAKIFAEGMEVGNAYDTAIQQVLAHPDLSKWEYLLTIEHDNVPPSDGVLKLLEDMEQHPEFACIGGLYWCKGPGGCAHLWGSPQEDHVQNFRPQVPIDGIMETYGTSMGFNLWRMEMFRDKRIQWPLFQTLRGDEGKGMGTQDLVAWQQLRKLGYRCAVNCRIKVGHLDYDGSYGPRGMVW